MTERLGISIGQHELCAVLTRKRRIAWNARAAAIDELLSAMPIRRRKPVAHIVVGAAHATVKVVEGVPVASSSSSIDDVVKENTEAFFLGAGPRVVAPVERHDDGALWAASFDAEALDRAITALRARGIERVSVVPLVSIIASLVSNGRHRIVDDGVATDVSIENRRIVSSKRGPTSDDPILPDLESTSGISPELMAAYLAAISPEGLSHSWRPPPPRARVRRRARTRSMLAMVALAVSSIAAIAAPGLRASFETRRAMPQLRESEVIRREVGRVDGQLRRASMDLDRAARFGAGRGRVSLLLADLARSLPDSTAVLSVRVDSAELSVAALALHAADVVSQIGTMDDVTNARVVGSVTREVQGGVHLERATFRMHRRASRP